MGENRHDFNNCSLWLPEEESNYWGFPVIHGIDELPEDAYFTNSEYLRKTKDYNSWVMFYEWDWKFERMWQQPKRQAKWLSNFAGAISPQFSCYYNVPLAVTLKSIYKNRWCGAYWESLGIPVIPDVSWSDARSFDFCFDGLPHNSIISIGSMGNHADSESRDMWLRGFDKACDVLTPKLILIYGSKFPELSESLPIKYIAERKKNT